MYFELESRAQHTGTETYAVTFSLREQDDLYDVQGFGVQFTIRPETVTLVWERERDVNGYGPWRRSGTSAVKGSRVLQNGDTSAKQGGVREVFASLDVGGALTNYAASLPHLEQMIEELEKKLPA